MEMKTCSRCGEVKPLLAAFRYGRGYYGDRRSECRDCERERLKKWRAAHPEQSREQWTRANRLREERLSDEQRDIRKMKHRDAYLRRRYGMTLDEFYALRDAQNGVCAICLNPPKGKRVGGRGGHPELVVDHCHKTGTVRALLCNTCNSSLAHARENPETLRRMIEYVTDR